MSGAAERFRAEPSHLFIGAKIARHMPAVAADRVRIARDDGNDGRLKACLALGLCETMPARVRAFPKLTGICATFKPGHSFHAFSWQKSPASVRRGQKNDPGLREAFIGVLWAGQRGADFFDGSPGAGPTWGGSAPIAFSRSTMTRKSPARPSPSITIGKPSSVAVIVNLADGAGSFSAAGLICSEVFVINSFR